MRPRQLFNIMLLLILALATVVHAQLSKGKADIFLHRAYHFSLGGTHYNNVVTDIEFYNPNHEDVWLGLWMSEYYEDTEHGGRRRRTWSTEFSIFSRDRERQRSDIHFPSGGTVCIQIPAREYVRMSLRSYEDTVKDGSITFVYSVVEDRVGWGRRCFAIEGEGDQSHHLIPNENVEITVGSRTVQFGH